MTLHTGKSGRTGWVIPWVLLLEARLAHSRLTAVSAWMDFPNFSNPATLLSIRSVITEKEHSVRAHAGVRTLTAQDQPVQRQLRWKESGRGGPAGVLGGRRDRGLAVMDVWLTTLGKEVVRERAPSP